MNPLVAIFLACALSLSGAACNLTQTGPGFAVPDAADPSFGAHGIVRTPVRGGGYASAIAAQPDGKFVVGGSGFAVARYTSDGAPDTAFGQRGLVWAEFGESSDDLDELAVAPDGRIIAVGRSFQLRERGPLAVPPGPETISAKLALACFLPDGRLDPSFGEGGKLTLLQAADHHDAGMVVDREGHILVLVSMRVPVDSRSSSGLLRLQPDGRPDPTFGTDGWTRIDDFAPDWVTHQSLAVQSDGRILVVGHDLHGPSLFVVARYNSDGSHDLSFGKSGVLRTDLDPAANHFAEAVVEQPDGKLVVAGSYELKPPPGYMETADSGDVIVARFLSDGRLDESFGLDGHVIVSDPRGPADEHIRAVALQPDNKVVLVGATQRNTEQLDAATGRARMSMPLSTEVALWRLMPNGALDSEFGVDGQITFLRTEGFTSDTVSDLLAQEHGLVAALAVRDMPSEFVALRFRT